MSPPKQKPENRPNNDDLIVQQKQFFAHGVMGHRIDSSWWIHFSFPPVLHDKAMVYTILSVG